jgi:hypothetical protein
VCAIGVGGSEMVVTVKVVIIGHRVDYLVALRQWSDMSS